MGTFIDEKYYNRIKFRLNGVNVLDKKAVNDFNDEFGASEMTLRRIKKSHSFGDYKRICRLNNPKKNGVFKSKLQQVLKSEYDKLKNDYNREVRINNDLNKQVAKQDKTILILSLIIIPLFLISFLSIMSAALGGK